MLRAGVFAFAALSIAGCATPGGGAAEARDCFLSASVNGYSVIDRNTIEVRVGASRRYLLTTDWDTQNLDFSRAIAIRSSTGSVCVGNGLGVEIIGGDPVQTYPIDAVARAPAAPQS